MNKFNHLDVKIYDSLPDEYIIINIVVDGLNFELDNLLQVVVVEYTKYGEIIESSYNFLEGDIDVFKALSHKLDGKFAISFNPRLIGKFIYSNLSKKTDIPNIKFISFKDLYQYFGVNCENDINITDYFVTQEISLKGNVLNNICLVNNEFLKLKSAIDADLEKKIESIEL